MAVLHGGLPWPQSVSLGADLVFLSGVTELIGSTVSPPPVVLAWMKSTEHTASVGFGLSIYQPISLGPGMISFP